MKNNKLFINYLPSLNRNAVLQLVILQGVFYCLLGILWAVLEIVNSGSELVYNAYIMPHISLTALPILRTHWWAIFFYGWMHRPHEFLGYLADSVWLYTFGLAVQNLVGHKHVIPIFLYALLLGGIAYFLMLFAPGVWGRVGTPQFITPVAGILALGFAGLNLAPGSRIYFSERINIPMPVIVGVYAAVMLLFMGSVPAVLLCMVGAFVGYNYITLLKAGYNPGGWIYAVVDYCNNMFTPKAKKKPFNSGSYSGAPKNTTIRPSTGGNLKVTQSVIDQLLDKINQKGYHSLTDEEKDILKRASGSE